MHSTFICICTLFVFNIIDLHVGSMTEQAALAIRIQFINDVCHIIFSSLYAHTQCTKTTYNVSIIINHTYFCSTVIITLGYASGLTMYMHIRMNSLTCLIRACISGYILCTTICIFHNTLLNS